MEGGQRKMKNIKFFLLGILFLSSLLFFTAKTVRADLVITWTTPPNSTSSDPNPSGTWTSTGGYIDVHFIANGADYTWAGTTTVTNPTHSQKGVVLLRLSYDWFDKFNHQNKDWHKSIKAKMNLELVDQVNKTYDKKISYSELYKYDTIRSLCDHSPD